MSGHLKKSKISCFLIQEFVIYHQLRFVLLASPTVVLFPCPCPNMLVVKADKRIR